jgi:hypothetical protein
LKNIYAHYLPALFWVKFHQQARMLALLFYNLQFTERSDAPLRLPRQGVVPLAGRSLMREIENVHKKQEYE